MCNTQIHRLICVSSKEIPLSREEAEKRLASLHSFDLARKIARRCSTVSNSKQMVRYLKVKTLFISELKGVNAILNDTSTMDKYVYACE